GAHTREPALRRGGELCARIPANGETAWRPRVRELPARLPQRGEPGVREPAPRRAMGRHGTHDARRGAAGVPPPRPTVARGGLEVPDALVCRHRLCLARRLPAGRLAAVSGRRTPAVAPRSAPARCASRSSMAAPRVRL